MKKTPKWYKNKIDEARREFVRKRDSNFQGFARCITCSGVGDFMQVGHFTSRTYDFSTEIGGDMRATNLQCVPCNGFRGGAGAEYCLAVDRKYGEGTCEELIKKKNTPKKWKIADLENLLNEYKTKVKEIC